MLYDILVVGGGVAGLTTAAYCARAIKGGGCMKGQASMDFLMVMSLLFIILVPTVSLFYNYTRSTREQAAITQSGTLAKQIISNAEKVYYFGFGSRLTLELTMPEGVNSIKVAPHGILEGQKELVINVTTGDGYAEIVSLSKVPLRRSLQDTKGYKLRQRKTQLGSCMSRLGLCNKGWVCEENKRCSVCHGIVAAHKCHPLSPGIHEC